MYVWADILQLMPGSEWPPAPALLAPCPALPCSLLTGAQVEARSARNGLGLVKLMGRQSGFIAMQASMASGRHPVFITCYAQPGPRLAGTACVCVWMCACPPQALHILCAPPHARQGCTWYLLQTALADVGAQRPACVIVAVCRSCGCVPHP